MDDVTYDRGHLVQVLIRHQQMEFSQCLCGWGQRPQEVGRLHAVHVA